MMCVVCCGLDACGCVLFVVCCGWCMGVVVFYRCLCLVLFCVSHIVGVFRVELVICNLSVRWVLSFDGRVALLLFAMCVLLVFVFFFVNV